MTDNSDRGSSTPGSGPAGRVIDAVCRLLQLLRFFSRLPVPVLPFERAPHGQPDFARAAPLVPAAGALLHLVGAMVLVSALWLNLPPLIAAILAVLALTWSTGAFHEDGLADTADGIGGGRQRDDKLRIMRDSRIGTFGAAALFFGLALRIALVEALVTRSGALAAAAIVVSGGALSRGCALVLPLALPPAQSDGAAFAAGTPSARDVAASLAVSLTIVAILLAGPLGLQAPLAGLAAAAFATGCALLVARRYLGGQTGDMAGATQQACEISFQLAILAGLV